MARLWQLLVSNSMRSRLVAAAAGVENEVSAYQLNSEEPLPGIHAAWFFEDAAASTLPQVCVWAGLWLLAGPPLVMPQSIRFQC